MKENGPPPAIKLEMLYDPDTGFFTWLRDSNNFQKLAGDIAGYTHSSGYIRFKFRGKMYAAHQVAWWWENGEWPVKEVDHINGNRSDNRISNLRLVNAAQQRANAKLNSDNSSGFRGVYFNKRRGKWRAHIQRQHLGYFDTKEQAALAYQSAFDLKFGAEFRRPEP